VAPCDEPAGGLAGGRACRRTRTAEELGGAGSSRAREEEDRFGISFVLYCCPPILPHSKYKVYKFMGQAPIQPCGPVAVLLARILKAEMKKIDI